MLKKRIAVECMDRIDLFVKSLLVTLLCLTIVLGYSAGARAVTMAAVAGGGQADYDTAWRPSAGCSSSSMI